MNRIEKYERPCMTRRKKSYIRQAILELEPEEQTNILKISERIAANLEKTYGCDVDGEINDKKLNYQTKRMGMGTTSKIKKHVEVYLLTHLQLVNK